MNAPCPDDDVLRGLLDSSLPEPVQREVTSHLDSCADCQSKLESIAGGGTSVLQVARQIRTEERPGQTSAYWPALERVELEMQSSGISLSSTRLDPSRKVQRASNDFSFLDPAENPAHIGAIDRFQVVELVGRGGMGMVFRAFDSCLQRTVAIKLLEPQYARNEQARSRFIREARAAAGVTHENVVTIHHVECVEERDLSFIVMQFVPGRSLQDWLDQNGRLPVREAVRIAAATASGLAAAHATNLIHRDIKPGNILIEQTSGRVLLTDFGLARLTEDVKLTQTGFVAGTPLYMSPEQARGETVDHRSDLFSLGSVLYAMLAGVPPFPGNSPFSVLKQVTDKEHKPLQSLNPDVPDSLAEVVDRLLEKDPSNRFDNAEAAAIALRDELRRLPSDPSTSSVRRSRLLSNHVRAWKRQGSLVALAVIAALFLIALALEAAGVTRWTLIGQRRDKSLSPVAEFNEQTSTPTETDTPTRYSLPPGDGAIWAVAFDPCGDLIATATEGGAVQFWDANEGHIRGVLANQKYKSPIWSIAFSKDGSRLVTASDDGYVRLWDVKTKQEADIDFKHPFPVRSVAMSPDGTRLVSGTRNGAVIFWDVETGEKVHVTNGHETGNVNAVAFSPDGRFAASAGSDKTIKVWDVEDGSPRATFSNHTGPVYTVAFDPTSQLLASAGWDHTIRIWDVNTSEQIKVIDVNRDDVWSVAFCPAGRCLLSGGQDGTMRWIDIATGEVKQTFHSRGGPVHSVAVSKDGSMVAAGSRDGAVRVWNTHR